jgi:triacylglycerol lipase
MRSRRFVSLALAVLFAGSAVGAVEATGAVIDSTRAESTVPGRPVALLHGLALSSFSLRKITAGLKRDGFRVCPIDYPSRKYPIDTLVVRYVLPELRRCFPDDTIAIDFVTHSMGGILVRTLSSLPEAPRIGRVVMIAPPNQGSEVVDRLHGTWYFNVYGGPAGNELGTDSNSAPTRLTRAGPPAFEFGVIAGTRSVDPIFSEWIEGRDDGKVAVEHTKLEGMRDFIEIPASHTVILWKDETLRQVRAFLRDGKFARP